MFIGSDDDGKETGGLATPDQVARRLIFGEAAPDQEHVTLMLARLYDIFARRSGYVLVENGCVFRHEPLEYLEAAMDDLNESRGLTLAETLKGLSIETTADLNGLVRMFAAVAAFNAVRCARDVSVRGLEHRKVNASPEVNEVLSAIDAPWTAERQYLPDYDWALIDAERAADLAVSAPATRFPVPTACTCDGPHEPKP